MWDTTSNTHSQLPKTRAFTYAQKNFFRKTGFWHPN